MTKITGGKAHAARLKRLSGATMQRELGKSLFAAGQKVEVEAAISMTAGRSEVVDKKNHVPSKPGEPPAVLYGDLRRSLTTAHIAPLQVEVRADDEKAAWLEYGTSKMAARPYMRPARDKMLPAIERMIADAVKRVICRGRR